MARRVFFSFHYQDVIDFRANVVRNHNVTKDNNAGYFDASIWEESRKQGDIALKRLINGGLDNTSVTVVLIGSSTCIRRWVRYEIIKSIECGNKVIGIHINGIPDKNRQTKPYGNNPFDYLSLAISENGKRATPREWNGTEWRDYNDLGAFEINELPLELRGQVKQLSYWFPVYDWIGGKGFENFGTWVE